MKEPTRLCTSCRSRNPKSTLIRVVKLEGTLVVDEKKRMDGRGAYICKNRECIKLARKRHTLERALGAEVQDAVYDALDAVVDCDL